METTILRVNLNTGAITEESAERYRGWVGGIGVAERILYDEVKPWVSALEPANRFIVCTGALSGTNCPGSGRIMAVTKSPMTTGIASGNAGGSFGASMRYAGFDYIVLEGHAPRPVYLYLKGGKAELRSAEAIWGLPIDQTVDWLEEANGSRISTMCIGPAGERLVRFACVTVDRHRVIGKCGFGAVMGSKNLKCIVADGTVGTVSVADPMGFSQKVDEIYARIQNSTTYRELMKYGTLCHIPGKVATGGFSYRHSEDLNIPPEMVKAYEPEYLRSTFQIRQTSCAGCFVGCQNRHRIPSGPYAGLEMEGSPFNSVFNFGTKLDVPDFAFCIKATWLCNNLGMDMDAVAELLGFLMECCEKNLITAEQLDGLCVRFGDTETALKIIEKIAYREGVGDLLAEGVARAGSAFGNEARYYGFSMKGNDLYELMRPLIGYGLGAATSTRGGSHVLGSPVCESAKFSAEEQAVAYRKFGVSTFNAPLEYEGKPEIVMYYETISRACSSLGLCLFASDWMQINMLDHEDLAELYSLAAGTEMTGEQLRKQMMAVLNLEKMFNYCHAGFTREDDVPNERLFREAAKSGPAAGAILDHEKWDAMLTHYYQIHGWNPATGVPTEETLAAYGLEDLIPDLSSPARASGKIITV